MLSHIPSWVFAVLLLLVALGYRQSRDRFVTPRTLALIALAMLGFSLYGVLAAFGAGLLPLLGWALGFVLVLGPGRSLVGPRDMQAVPGAAAVRVPGSWLPFFLMMGIFAVKFVLGYGRAMHLPLVQQAAFVAGASAVLGVCSGAFAARALTVFLFAHRRPGLTLA
ncbi:DUF6622 family protein [Hydrogenophaga palleronii]|uniref:DUF6622 family protein n=1 Tax=Hydrogenophaga palleronii TaxID=65655 RepID=UPI000A6D8376